MLFRSIQGACINKAEFVSETIPDGSNIDVGAEFTKSWTIENTGTCVWNTNYELIFESGDQLSGTDFSKLLSVVNPGNKVTINIDLKAPSSPGFFISNWILRSDTSDKFIKLYLKITVPGAPKSNPSAPKSNPDPPKSKYK